MEATKEYKVAGPVEVRPEWLFADHSHDCLKIGASVPLANFTFVSTDIRGYEHRSFTPFWLCDESVYLNKF